jgi:hypothetical protein
MTDEEATLATGQILRVTTCKTPAFRSRVRFLLTGKRSRCWTSYKYQTGGLVFLSTCQTAKDHSDRTVEAVHQVTLQPRGRCVGFDS